MTGDPLLAALSQPEPTPQEEMAKLLGYDSVDAMNSEHDPLHARVELVFGQKSWALAAAAGQKLTPDQQELATMEEVAVLCLQRYLQRSRNVGAGFGVKA